MNVLGAVNKGLLLSWSELPPVPSPSWSRGWCVCARAQCSAFLFRSENAAGHGSKEVKGKTHTYYQVLIDARDCPHIVSNKCHLAGETQIPSLMKAFLSVAVALSGCDGYLGSLSWDCLELVGQICFSSRNFPEKTILECHVTVFWIMFTLSNLTSSSCCHSFSGAWK